MAYTIVRNEVYKKRTEVVKTGVKSRIKDELNQRDAQFGPKSTGQSATPQPLFVVILIGRLYPSTRETVAQVGLKINDMKHKLNLTHRHRSPDHHHPEGSILQD